MNMTYACCDHCITDDEGLCIDAPAGDHINACAHGCDDEPDEWSDDDGLTDVEADAMTLASAGWGTDEDYGYFGDDFGGEW